MDNHAITRMEAKSPHPSTFYRFPTLPPELRIMVWEQAFLSIASRALARDWELLLRRAQDGGAAVVRSDKGDTPWTAGPSRDQYIMNLRRASWEANACFVKYISMKVFTPAPCVMYPRDRYKLGRVDTEGVWLCPDTDQWMFNFEFNSLGAHLDPNFLPCFGEWKSELEAGDRPGILNHSLSVLNSIRHLRIGFRALAGFSEHEVDLFLESLPRLARISIYLEPIGADQVPSRYEAMMVNRAQGRDFSYENRHVTAHAFFLELPHVELRSGKMMTVPAAALKDFDPPHEQTLLTPQEFLDLLDLKTSVCDAMKQMTARPFNGGHGLDGQDFADFVDRWVALGDRGVERVLVTRFSSRNEITREYWPQDMIFMLEH